VLQGVWLLALGGRGALLSSLHSSESPLAGEADLRCYLIRCPCHSPLNPKPPPFFPHPQSNPGSPPTQPPPNPHPNPQPTVTIAFPQSISVTSSPSLIAAASTCSISTRSSLTSVLAPAAGHCGVGVHVWAGIGVQGFGVGALAVQFLKTNCSPNQLQEPQPQPQPQPQPNPNPPPTFLCRGTSLSSGLEGPPSSASTTAPPSATAVWRPQTGSITRLLIVQILSHSCQVSFLEAPCERMNSLRASTWGGGGVY